MRSKVAIYMLMAATVGSQFASDLWAAGESPYRFDSLVLRGIQLDR